MDNLKMKAPFTFRLWPNLDNIGTLKTHIFKGVGKVFEATETREIDGVVKHYVPALTADLPEDDMCLGNYTEWDLCDMLESCALEMENRGELAIARMLYSRAAKVDPMRFEDRNTDSADMVGVV